MVTKELLAQLRAERERKNLHQQYNMDGQIHNQVVSNIDKHREKMIYQCEHYLQTALEDFRREQSLSSHHGLVKAHFNKDHEDIKP